MDEQPILTSEESQPILYELFECNIQENGKLNNNDDENFKSPLGFFFSFLSTFTLLIICIKANFLYKVKHNPQGN